ncbi:unnamed protein product [Eretmochelys imbricata]
MTSPSSMIEEAPVKLSCWVCKLWEWGPLTSREGEYPWFHVIDCSLVSVKEASLPCGLMDRLGMDLAYTPAGAMYHCSLVNHIGADLYPHTGSQVPLRPAACLPLPSGEGSRDAVLQSLLRKEKIFSKIYFLLEFSSFRGLGGHTKPMRKQAHVVKNFKNHVKSLLQRETWGLPCRLVGRTEFWEVVPKGQSSF